MVPTDIKRLWLRERWSKVPSQFATLLAAIESTAFASVEGGRNGTIAATSANGNSVQFAIGGQNLSGEDYAALGGEMLDLYEAASDGLIAAGFTTPTDAQIFDEMKDRLQPIREVRNSFRNIRQPGGVTR